MAEPKKLPDGANNIVAKILVKSNGFGIKCHLVSGTFRWG